MHLERGRAVLYRGNYSAFERQRGEQLARQAAFARRQAQKVDAITRFVERFRAKSTKARQVQSRLKALERLEISAPAHVDSPYEFSFPNPAQISPVLIQLDDATLGYPGRPILEAKTLRIAPGARIGVLGVNGAGKTTLMRTLAGDLPLLGGTLFRGQHSDLGYFAQHQLELLRADQSALEQLRLRTPMATDQRRRTYLGGWGFSGDIVLRPVATLSGGEKARLVLALIAWQQPTLLLLDEPTNHLDIEMRHALSVALQAYEGAMVIVSHDRDLLARCVDELWLVSDGVAQAYSGDLEDYTERIRQRVAPALAPTTGTAPSRRERRQASAEHRRRTQALRNAIQHLESRVESMSIALKTIDAKLANPDTYESMSTRAVQDLIAQRTDALRDLAAAEADWVESLEQLEAMLAADKPAREGERSN
jgi:ATP-binding cassette subfamily F protein 3